MKNRKRKFYAVIILAVITSLLFLSACGANTRTEAPKAEEQKAVYDTASATSSKRESKEDADFGFTSATDGSAASQYEQMMIYRGHFRIQVDDINNASDQIMATIEAAQGYLVNSSQTENDYRYSAHFEFRIPVEGYNNVRSQIKDMKLGKITSQDSNGQDVTEEYLDLDSRLKAKRVYEERLLEFLSKAEKTEDLLKISNDLNRVQEEIELIQGRQKYLSYHAAYSTLTIDLEQLKNKVAPTATTWEKAVDGFNKSIDALISLFTLIFIFLISALPVIIILLLILAILWPFRKKITKKIMKANPKKLNGENDDKIN